MKRTVIVIVFAAALLADLVAPRLLEREALAQTSRQCMSWTVESGGSLDDVATFLAGAKTVELTSAGLSIANRFALVACRQ